MELLNRAKFQRLAAGRLKDAKVLLRNRRFAAAYYLADYVVECGLKACIAKQTRRYDFPDKGRVNESFKHNLVNLAKIAGLDPDGESKRDKRFGFFWKDVKDWSEQSRYQVISDKEARDLIRAISDPKHGVLRWLREHW